MSAITTLYELMQEALPRRTFQRKLSYRTSTREVLLLFRMLNKEIFNNKLPTPKIEVMGRCRDYWGICSALDFTPTNSSKSNCSIKLSDKWYCKHWLITVLAHEMCHQYQWDVHSQYRKKRKLTPIISHGPSFFMHKKKLARLGIPLKRSHRHSPWFEHQDLFKT